MFLLILTTPTKGWPSFFWKTLALAVANVDSGRSVKVANIAKCIFKSWNAKLLFHTSSPNIVLFHSVILRFFKSVSCILYLSFKGLTFNNAVKVSTAFFIESS